MNHRTAFFVKLTVSCLFFGLVETSVLSATVVHTVYEAPTTTGNSWSHMIDETGDYQIGIAWMQVLSGGSVDIEVRVNRKNLLTRVTAAPGEVTRFETRIEDLLAGDTLDVYAIPGEGASYRVGFQIGISTPTFDPRLSVFAVSNYGAVGDGETDDFAGHSRYRGSCESGPQWQEAPMRMVYLRLRIY